MPVCFFLQYQYSNKSFLHMLSILHVAPTHCSNTTVESKGNVLSAKKTVWGCRDRRLLYPEISVRLSVPPIMYTISPWS